MISSTETCVTRRSFLEASTLAAATLSAAGLGSAGLFGCSAAADSPTSTGATSSDAEVATGAPTVLQAALDYPAPLAEISPIGNTRALWLAAGWHVYEGLYDVDYRTFTPRAALAEGDPVQVSDTEFEVILREGAKFSDGSAVTPADVVNAFERNMLDATYSSMLSFIDSVAVKDDVTISILLNQPFGRYLKNRLALVRIFPSSMADEDLSQMPVGSGPWCYASFETDSSGFVESIEFVSNPYYEGSLPAACERMWWKVSSDGETRCELLRDGSVSICENVPFSAADRLKDGGFTVEFIQGFGQAFLMFNCQKKPFDDPRVRQAFFYAINVDELIASEMGGHAMKVTSFLPKTFENYHEASTVYTYDPEKAKKLLAEAGVEELEFELTTNNNWVKSLTGRIQEDLAAVGISMKNNETRIDWAQLAPSDDDAVLPFDVILTPGDPSCFGSDPDLLLNWWYGDNVWTRGRSCWAKTGDGKFEELQALIQHARAANAAEQQSAWNQCFDLISEEVPIYALFHREIATAYDESAVVGFESIGTTGLALAETQLC